VSNYLRRSDVINPTPRSDRLHGNGSGSPQGRALVST
jgi:hypothetical protein